MLQHWFSYIHYARFPEQTPDVFRSRVVAGLLKLNSRTDYNIITLFQIRQQFARDCTNSSFRPIPLNRIAVRFSNRNPDQARVFIGLGGSAQIFSAAVMLKNDQLDPFPVEAFAPSKNLFKNIPAF